MNCEEAYLLISGRLDAGNTAEEEAQLNEHLASCPSCQKLWQELQRIDGDVQDLQEETPAGFCTEVMQEIRKQARKRKFRPVYQVLTAAAAVALVIGLGVREVPKETAMPETARSVGTAVTADCMPEEAPESDGASAGIHAADLAETYRASVVVVYSVLEELKDCSVEMLADGSRLYRLEDKNGAEKLSQSYELELYQPREEPAADISYAWLQP